MTEYEVTTIYLPISDRLGWSSKFSDILNLEVTNWLAENVGPQAPSFQAFVANLENDSYGWCFRYKDTDPTDYQNHVICYCLSFKNANDAMMFKLKWA